MRELRRLVVVEQDIHHRHAGQLWGYGPYVREIDVWADLFPEVVIAAPCRDEPPPGDYLPFSRPNISVRPQRQTGGPTLGAKARQVLAVPGHLYRLGRALADADAVHVRCPGNLGLLGVLLAPLFPRPRVAKYAGQWCGFDDEPWSWRLQRAVLRSRWWRGPVTVYGRWPGQPAHVVPFFTSILSSDQVARARAAAAAPKFADGLRVLYVGRLSEAKNVDVLLRAIASLPPSALPTAWSSPVGSSSLASCRTTRRRTYSCWPRSAKAGPRPSPRPWHSVSCALARTPGSCRRCWVRGAASWCRRVTSPRSRPRCT
jgi:glycosyltransferase involved in cell wall biosynthesis